MTPLDEALGDLAEVWVWPTPHPDDVDDAGAGITTRIGRRDGDRLRGRLCLRTTPIPVFGGEATTVLPVGSGDPVASVHVPLVTG